MKHYFLNRSKEQKGFRFVGLGMILNSSIYGFDRVIYSLPDSLAIFLELIAIGCIVYGAISIRREKQKMNREEEKF